MENGICSRGRVVYIDPNELAAYENSKDGTINDGNISWNQEDLQYSVDLQVYLPNRSDCGQWKSMGKVSTTIKNESHGKMNKYISFLTGNLNDPDTNANYLTDSYTNISYQTISSEGVSEKETFGINSINIDFDAHFYPVVKINFTDVRGSALFSPMETEYRANKPNGGLSKNEEDKVKDGDTIKSFFASVMHFPYPKFLLTIKGYYGDKVTFILAPSDFKSRFNSTNGNFDVDITFIGYMYGLYTDIPMNLIFAAPYFNKSYWQHNTEDENGSFYYITKNGEKGGKILTFIEFLNRYYHIVDNIDSEKLKNSTELKDYKAASENKNTLEEIRDNYKNILQDLANGTNNKNLIITGSTTTIYFSKEDHIEIENGYIKRFSQLYNNSSINKFDLPTEMTFYNNNFVGFSNELVSKSSTNVSGETVYSEEGYNKLKSTLDKDYKDDTVLIENFNRVFSLSIAKNKYDGLRFYIHNNKGLTTVLNNRIMDIQKEIDKLKNGADENLHDLLMSSLGFELSVENVYRMLFAHIDTFIDSYDKVLKAIYNNKERIYKKLELTEKNSDRPKKYNDETKVPPFPSYFINGDGYERKSIYPGDRTKDETLNLREIEEVKYIDKIFDALSSYGEDLNDIISKIENIDNVEKLPFKPTSYIDYFYGKKNPYSYILKKEGNGDKITASDLIYFLYCRIVIALSTKPDTIEISDIIDREIENLFSLDFVISEKLKYELQNTNFNGLRKGISGRTDKIIFPSSNPIDLKDEDYVVFYNPYNKKDIENKVNGKKLSDIRGLNIIDDKDYAKSISMSINEKYTANLNEWYGNGGYLYQFSKMTVLDENTRKYRNANAEEYGKNCAVVDNNGNNRDFDFNFIGLFPHINNTMKTNNRKYINFYLTKEDDGKNAYLRQNDRVRSLIFLNTLIENFKNVEYTLEKIKNIDNSMVCIPRLLLLYYGCILYINSNEEELLNIVTDDIFITDNGVKEYISIDEKSGKKKLTYNTITNKNGIIFFDGKIGKDKIDIYNYFNEKEQNILKQYYNKWFNNEFSEKNGIEYILSNVKEEDINKDVRLSYYTGKFEDVVQVIGYKNNSPQSILLKNIIGETVYINKVNKIQVSEKDYNSYIKDDLYKKLRTKVNNILSKEEQEQKDEENSNKDGGKSVELKKALYYTLKILYDKWLCTYTADQFKLKTPKEDIKKREKRFAEGKELFDDGNNSEYNSFLYINSCYNDISRTFMINPDTIIKLLKENMSIDGAASKNRSVFEFMADLAEKNKLLFMSLPIFTNFYDKSSIANIFKPQFQYGTSPTTSNRGYGNTYILMYTGEQSSKVGGDYGDYPEDYYDFGNMLDPSKPIPPELADTKENSANYNIPVFGVTYAKQNQMYFKNINVDMSDPKVTDYSAANMLMIANGGAHGDDIYAYGIGQNIYSIYSNRSYTCTVEMMGCMNIMPTMMFQLNGIPMFRGLYYIYSVSHNIVQGNMTTKFTGVRISKNHLGNVETSFDYQTIYNKIKGGIGSSNVVPKFEKTKLDDSGIWPSGGKITSNSPSEKQRMETMIEDVEIEAWLNQTTSRKLSVKINKAIKDKFVKAFKEIHDTKFIDKDGKEQHIVISTLKTYDWREVIDSNGNKTGRLSNHSYGIAFDINGSRKWIEGTNPYMQKTVYENDSQHPECKIDSPSQFRTWEHPAVKILNKYGFGWGRYANNEDFMHFSYDSYTDSNGNLHGH